MSQSLEFFERYRPIIDDWDAFEACVRRPLPATIWTNPLKTTPDLLAKYLNLKPIPWYPGAFRCPDGLKPSRQLPYLAGHYQLQEEAAFLPVYLMQPQPDELILDLCAAPGNKTAQIAVAMESKGLVVANDRSRARLGILRRTISRLGLTNIAMTVYDATSFRGAPASYDKILTDVPCSGEGTIRRHNKSTKFISKKRRSHLNNIQLAILSRAISLCKPGGLIIYSTCTFAPEENECIINSAVSKYGNAISVIPANAPGFITAPGLESWNGQTFHPSLRNTIRVWPHLNDTGGFFTAVLQKTAPLESSYVKVAGQKVTTTDSDPQASAPIKSFEDRFGISSRHFKGMRLQQFGKTLSIRSFDSLPPGLPTPIQAGMPFCQPPEKSQKLKTGAAMKWGALATKNVIELSYEQAFQYGNKNDFEIDSTQIATGMTRGYVILKWKEMYLGLGFLRLDDDQPTIESLIPKHWIHSLQETNQ